MQLRSTTTTTAQPIPSDPPMAPPEADPTSEEWIGAIYIGRRANFIREHRRSVTAIVLLVSVATCIVMCLGAGWHLTSSRLHHLDWWFLPLALLAHLIAYAGYLLAHHFVVNRSRSSSLRWLRGIQIVVIGFGGWLVGGGFTVGRHALRATGASQRRASISTIALGLLELLVLTPAAWGCALTLLWHKRIPASVTWPWVIGVPLGFAFVLSTALIPAAPSDGKHGFWREALSQVSIATRVSLKLFTNPKRSPMVTGGIALYWAADIVALWTALRFVSVWVPFPNLIVAYATGYIFTRRTLPFAGVVIIEVLLALSIWSVGPSLAAAALAVLFYRLTDFVLTLGAALLASSRAERTLTFVQLPGRATASAAVSSGAEEPR